MERFESHSDQLRADGPQCPLCNSATVRRSRRRNLRDRMMSIFSRLPFRCEECDLRFYGLRSELRLAYLGNQESAQ